MATTDLGKWMITNGGNYDPEATYEQLTMVMYGNSTYITLRTVTGITPSNDNQNYILMAQGFDATALSSIQAEDTSGLLGEPGGSVSAQSLVDYLADAVATKLLKKTDIATSIENSNSSVPASSLLYELNSDMTPIFQNINYGGGMSEEYGISYSLSFGTFVYVHLGFTITKQTSNGNDLAQLTNVSDLREINNISAISKNGNGATFKISGKNIQSGSVIPTGETFVLDLIIPYKQS